MTHARVAAGDAPEDDPPAPLAAVDAEVALPQPARRDLLSGPILPALLVLAAPLLASNIGPVIYQVTDLSFISRLGEEAMASVIIANQTIWQIIVMIVMGSSFATQALIAQAIGAGDHDRAGRIAGQTILLAATFSATVALIGALFAERLFALTGSQPHFAPFGVPYLRLILMLNGGLCGALLLRGVLVGSGDATTPLLVSLVQTPIALLVEWTLIFGHFGAPALGVRGVALGLVSGQLLAASIYATVLARGRSRLHVRRRHLRPDPVIMKQIVRLAWPPAVQMMGMVATTFAVLQLTKGFGASIQAAYSIGLRIGMVVPLLSFPLVNACATLVGQALGARNQTRAWQAFRAGLLVHVLLMWSLLGLLCLFRGELLQLLSSDPEVIAAGRTYLLFFSGSFGLVAIYLVALRSLQGAGDFLAPMLLALTTTFVFTLPLAFVLAYHVDLGPIGVWTALLLHSLVTTTATVGWLVTRPWAKVGRAAAH